MSDVRARADRFLEQHDAYIQAAEERIRYVREAQAAVAIFAFVFLAYVVIGAIVILVVTL